MYRCPVASNKTPTDQHSRLVGLFVFSAIRLADQIQIILTIVDHG